MSILSFPAEREAADKELGLRTCAARYLALDARIETRNADHHATMGAAADDFEVVAGFHAKNYVPAVNL